MVTSALNPKHATFLQKKSTILVERKKEQGETINGTQEFMPMIKPYKDNFVDINFNTYA